MSAETITVVSVPWPAIFGVDGWSAAWANAHAVDGIPAERRPLALLHANPDRTAWVRLRHFRAAMRRLDQRVLNELAEEMASAQERSVSNRPVGVFRTGLDVITAAENAYAKAADTILGVPRPRVRRTVRR